MKYMAATLITEAPTVSFAELTWLHTWQSSVACLCDLLFYGWGNMGFGKVNDLVGWVLQLVDDPYINPHCNRIFRVLCEDVFLCLSNVASLGPLFRGLSALKHVLKAISKWSALGKLKVRHLCGCPWWEREQCGGLVEMSGQIPWNSKQRWGCWSRLLILDEPGLPPFDIDSVLPPGSFSPRPPGAWRESSVLWARIWARILDGRDWKATVVGVQGLVGTRDLVWRLPCLAPGGSWEFWDSAPTFKGLKGLFTPTCLPPIYLLIPKPTITASIPSFLMNTPKSFWVLKKSQNFQRAMLYPTWATHQACVPLCQKTNTSFSQDPQAQCLFRIRSVWQVSNWCSVDWNNLVVILFDLHSVDLQGGCLYFYFNMSKLSAFTINK